jgi:uncharacterized protein YjbI with pentapeptide repeats
MARSFLGFELGKSPPRETLRTEKDDLKRLKETAWLNAEKAAAIQRTNDPNYKTSYSDYLIAAQQLGETQGLDPALWNAKTYAVMDGMKIGNGYFSSSHLEPPPEELRRAAIISANKKFDPTGRQKASASQVMEAMKDLHGKPLPAHSIEDMQNFLDLDQDKAIGTLYADIDRHARFHGTVFDHCSFHPAGTLMVQNDGVAISKGAIFNDCIFDGMGPDDTATLSPSKYVGTCFINPNGGTVICGPGAHADGFTIGTADGINPRTGEAERGNISLQLADGAYLGNLTVNQGARILDLQCGPGSTLSNSTINCATVSMGSTIAGTLQNVNFQNANLNGVDFSGATLDGVMIDGAPLTSLDQLRAMGATVDEATTFSGKGNNMPNPTQTAARDADPLAIFAGLVADVQKTAFKWNEDLASPRTAGPATPFDNKGAATLATSADLADVKTPVSATPIAVADVKDINDALSSGNGLSDKAMGTITVQAELSPEAAKFFARTPGSSTA